MNKQICKCVKYQREFKESEHKQKDRLYIDYGQKEIISMFLLIYNLWRFRFL